MARETTAAERSALAYFQAPPNYFWQWAENGEILEWRNGTTICYREELTLILTALAPDGRPALSTLLLLLTACTDSWQESGELPGILHGLEPGLPAEAEPVDGLALQWHLRHAAGFLDIVAALPRELRTGPQKLRLLREVLLDAQGPAQPDHFPALVAEWTSGRLDEQLGLSGAPLTRARYKADLLPLTKAARLFPTVEALTLRLRTGLDQLPAPLPELSVETLPAEPAADLLDELAQSPKTLGLARLAQRLVAALHIPMHAQGASDQPFGGVSDVTNRGSFDRLLLSELAHDDLALMARLVNNEALYLRREEPPHPENRHRVLLLDTTIRLWGVPRVFALAAALACAYHGRQPRQRTDITAYALGGTSALPLDLTTKAGVAQALTYLDPALHCGPALRACLGAPAPSAQTEYILFTEASLLLQPDFGRLLAEVRPQLRFLLTVDRSGELQFYECGKAGRSLLSTTRYDLDALLFAAPPARPPQPARTDLPAFLNCRPSPLLFPGAGLRASVLNTFYAPHTGVIGITDAQRVLFWARQNAGARELLEFIAPGAYCFGFADQAAFYIMVSESARKTLHYYRFPLLGAPVSVLDLSEHVKTAKGIIGVEFDGSCFFVRLSDTVSEALKFDCLTEKMSGPIPRYYLPAGRKAAPLTNQGQVKRFVNNGYSLLQRITRIGVDDSGALSIEGHPLRLLHDNQLQLASKTATNAEEQCVARPEIDPLPLPGNTYVTLRRLVWTDGSTAVVDGRGLLHLRSSDTSLPEVTLVLVLGQPSAAWAADGAVCGSPYFTGPDSDDSLSAAEFYARYLQPFIDRLA